MFGCSLTTSRARRPSAGSSSFVVGSDRPSHRCSRFRYPSRRSFAWRPLRRSICPSTCGHFFEYCPVGSNALTIGNTHMLFTVVEKHARDSTCLSQPRRARSPGRYATETLWSSRTSFPFKKSDCPRSHESKSTARQLIAASRWPAVIGTISGGRTLIGSALGRPPRLRGSAKAPASRSRPP
jgi:hypothetical protein